MARPDASPGIPPPVASGADDPATAPVPPRRHLAGGALSATAAQLATIGSATLTSVVIARSVGPSGNGTVALAGSLTNIVVQLFALGLATGVTYMISAGRWPALPALRVVQRAGGVLALVGAAAALALYALAGDALFSGLGWSVVAAAIVAVPFMFSWSLSSAVAIAEDRYELYAACFLGQAVAMLVLVVGLVGPFGAEGAVWGIAGSHVLTAVAALIAVRRATPAVPPAGADAWAERLRETLRFGLQTWVADLLALVAYRLDLFILNAYTSTAAVGYYSIAVSVTALAWVLPGALQSVLVPRAAQLSASDQEAEEADLLASRAVRHTLILLVPTALALAALLGAVIPVLYGSRFWESAQLGFVLLPGALALSLTKVLTSIVIGRGHPRYSMITTMIVTPLSVAAYFVLIAWQQAMGAALATTASYAASAALALLFFQRVTRLPLRRLFPRREDLEAYRQASGVLAVYVRDRLPGRR